MKHPEDAIQKAVIGQLKARPADGLVWFHVPQGNKLGGKRTASGAPLQAIRNKDLGVRAGVSDLILLHDGKAFALELKAEKGHLSEAQREFIDEWNNAGGYATCAVGIDQAVKVLETWSLIR